jgi:hypothetical protein
VHCSDGWKLRCKASTALVTHDFAFSGLVDCGHCGCSLVGEIKKKRYVYYHCTGYRGKCAEPYTREADLEQQFAQGLGELAIPRTILDWLQEELVASDISERAAREQALRRDQVELDRLQNRLDVLYEDRLDGRIDAATYDRKAAEVRQQQDRVRRRLAEVPALPSVSQAVDPIAVAAKAAELFLKQPGAEQRKLLRLVLDKGTWKGGELRMSFREPFSQLRLSNRESHAKDSDLKADKRDFDIWRRRWVSNPDAPKGPPVSSGLPLGRNSAYVSALDGCRDESRQRRASLACVGRVPTRHVESVRHEGYPTEIAHLQRQAEACPTLVRPPGFEPGCPKATVFEAAA